MKSKSLCSPSHVGGIAFCKTPLGRSLIALGLVLLIAGPVWALDYLAERREQVEQMSGEERDDLREKYLKFEALPPADQDQLRRLHEQLESDPQGDRLRRILLRYHEWLKTLTPGERADLLSLAPTERVTRIKAIKREQEARAASLAGGPQLLPRRRCAGRAVWRRSAERITAGVKPARRQEINGLEGAARHKALGLVAWAHWRTGNKLPVVSPTEVQRLIDQLSPAPRRALEAPSAGPDRVKIIHDWVQAIGRARFNNGGKGGSQISATDLANFMDHDMSQAERDRLMAMPQDEMKRELRRLYQQHKRATDARASDQEADTRHKMYS